MDSGWFLDDLFMGVGWFLDDSVMVFGCWKVSSTCVCVFSHACFWMLEGFGCLPKKLKIPGLTWYWYSQIAFLDWPGVVFLDGPGISVAGKYSWIGPVMALQVYLGWIWDGSWMLEGL